MAFAGAAVTEQDDRFAGGEVVAGGQGRDLGGVDGELGESF